MQLQGNAFGLLTQSSIKMQTIIAAIILDKIMMECIIYRKQGKIRWARFSLILPKEVFQTFMVSYV